MQQYAPIKEGKVREIYDVGDALIITATDRISAFDVILKNKVPEKGVFLDDLESNLETARELGIHTILVKDHEQAAADLRALLEES